MDSTVKLPEIRLYNTLSRRVDILDTIQPGFVGIYCCGPTVYNYQHVGNLRTYVFEDLLVRMLKYAGYRVKHVMNVTDVGHLVSDADDGEDKMLVAARREKKSSREVADHYSRIFFEDCESLHIRRPDVVCKATEHISQMIELVQRLEQNGLAYRSGGNLYFDVSKFPEYGRMAGLDLEELKAGARIDVDRNKRNPHDFALWFTKSKFENQELQWDSPWGRGYPGWHIECSAMSMTYLGEHFDIHCGGVDHIPVHHTNEIAQSQGATGKPLANCWMHAGFLVAGKGKMSKSTGGFVTLKEISENGLDPLCFRLFCMSSSYRKELAWSWEGLKGASNTLSRLRGSVLNWLDDGAELLDEGEFTGKLLDYKTEFDGALFDDLNSARALAVLHRVVGDAALSSSERYSLLCLFDSVLGLGVRTWRRESVEIPDEVSALVREREKARGERDWERADRLRAEIASLGFAVEDAKGGSVVKPLS